MTCVSFFCFVFLTPCRISELGELQARWQHFSRESDALSSWVCETEKELEAVDRHTAALESQIRAVEVKIEIEQSESVRVLCSSSQTCISS